MGKDVHNKQALLAEEKAIRDESAKLLKWIKATQGKLDFSPLQAQNDRLEDRLNKAQVSILFYLTSITIHLML